MVRILCIRRKKTNIFVNNVLVNLLNLLDIVDYILDL